MSLTNAFNNLTVKTFFISFLEKGFGKIGETC